MIECLDGVRPDASRNSVRASLVVAEASFTPVGLAFLDRAAPPLFAATGGCPRPRPPGANRIPLGLRRGGLDVLHAAGRTCSTAGSWRFLISRPSIVGDCPLCRPALSASPPFRSLPTYSTTGLPAWPPPPTPRGRPHSTPSRLRCSARPACGSGRISSPTSVRGWPTTSCPRGSMLRPTCWRALRRACAGPKGDSPDRSEGRRRLRRGPRSTGRDSPEVPEGPGVPAAGRPCGRDSPAQGGRAWLRGVGAAVAAPAPRRPAPTILLGKRTLILGTTPAAAPRPWPLRGERMALPPATPLPRPWVGVPAR